MTEPFLSRLRNRPLIFDGAMGSMICQKGVFVNTCFDELCLTRPELIADIHRAYFDAGAEVLETNTFGANRLRLKAYGLGDRVAAINTRAVEIARSVAGDSAYVVASVGPCLDEAERMTPANREAIRAAFREQLETFARSPVDAVILETFYDTDQLLLAAEEAAGLGLTVIASHAFHPAAAPETIRLASLRLAASPAVSIIGINCGCDPAQMLTPLAILLAHTAKPVIVMPNAGGIQEIGGRMLNLNTPEYFTEYAKKYIEMGVRGVGGCCGATPAHIGLLARTLSGVQGIKQFLSVEAVADPAGEPPPVPLAEKSRFGAALAAGKRVTSVEMLPPQTGAGLPEFLEKCRLCEAAGVDVVNLPDGPRASPRLSVFATAAAMLGATAIEPVPHLCCRDKNLIALQSDLLGGDATGLKNWLFITGDPPKLGNYPDATGVFDLDATGLVRLAANLNRGRDAAGQPLKARASLVMGVGANPAAIDLEHEFALFLRKIAAGAEYAITQPVFDPDALLRFVSRVRAAGHTIPLIAGLYPLLSFKNADFMNRHVPGVSVPPAILSRMAACETREEGIACGIAIAREIRDAVAGAVQGFQVSAPLGQTRVALDVLG